MKMKSVALHGKSIWPEVYTRQVITAKKKFTAVLNCALATGTDGENFNGDLSSEEDRVLTLDARGRPSSITLKKNNREPANRHKLPYLLDSAP